MANYLFLCLSTLPQNALANPTLYYYRNGAHLQEYSGIAQQEANTEVILDRLAQDGQRIDKIFAICTDRVLSGGQNSAFAVYRRNVLRYLTEGGSRMMAENKAILRRKDTLQVPPEAAARIAELAAALPQPIGWGDAAFAAALVQNGIDNSPANRFALAEALHSRMPWQTIGTAALYRDVSLPDPAVLPAPNPDGTYPSDALFQIIHIRDNEVDPIKAIPAVCRTLNRIDPNTENHLFVDNKGGMRTVTFIFNALLDVMRFRGLQPELVLDANYNNGNATNEIVNVTKQNEALLLISAFDEFKSHGQATIMKNYFNRSKGAAADYPEKQLVDTMVAFGEALATNVVSRFQPLMQEILACSRHYMQLPEAEKDSTFAMLLPDLMEDYSEAMRDDFSLIRWCGTKGLYMQQMALIESKLPAYLMQKHAISYARNLDEKQELLTKMAADYAGYKDKAAANYYKFEYPAHWAVRYGKKQKAVIYTNANEQLWSRLKDAYLTCCTNRNNIMHCEENPVNHIDVVTVQKQMLEVCDLTDRLLQETRVNPVMLQKVTKEDLDSAGIVGKNKSTPKNSANNGYRKPNASKPAPSQHGGKNKNRQPAPQCAKTHAPKPAPSDPQRQGHRILPLTTGSLNQQQQDTYRKQAQMVYDYLRENGGHHDDIGQLGSYFSNVSEYPSKFRGGVNIKKLLSMYYGVFKLVTGPNPNRGNLCTTSVTLLPPTE